MHLATAKMTVNIETGIPIAFFHILYIFIFLFFYFQYNSGKEINIWEKLPFYEIIIFQCGIFQGECKTNRFFVFFLIQHCFHLKCFLRNNFIKKLHLDTFFGRFLLLDHNSCIFCVRNPSIFFSYLKSQISEFCFF